MGVALAGGAAGGCASAPPHAVDWRAEGLALRNYPESYRRLFLRDVGVHEVSAVSTLVVTAMPEDRYVIDAGAVREGVRDALVGLGLFREVVPLDSSVAQLRTPGLILDLALDEAFLVHSGANEDADQAFWLWIFTGLPGLAVRDQVYELRFEPRARIIDAATGEVLVPWEPIAPPDRGPVALNFHERTTGFAPYLKVNVCPPARVGVDEREVLRQVLPKALRRPMLGLAQLFDQIAFLPVCRLEITPQQSRGVKVEGVRLPRGSEMSGDSVSLGLAVTIDEGVQSLREVRVDGATKLDYSDRARRPPTLETRTDLALDEIAVPPDKPVTVELVIEGVEKPQRVLTIKALPRGDVRPERRRVQ